jgi:hypothetical protein
MELLTMYELCFIFSPSFYWGAIFILIIGVIILFLYFKKIGTSDKNIENENSRINNYKALRNTDQYISENLLSVFIYIEKYYILIYNCLYELKENEIKEISENYNRIFEEQEIKWKQLEQAVLNNKTENAERTSKKIRSVLYINKILKSLIKNTKKYIIKNQNLIPSQHSQLNILLEEFNHFMNYAIHHQRSPNSNNLDEIGNLYNDICNRITKLKTKTLKQFKKQEITTKNSLFYIQFLSDTENILSHILKILTAE